MIFEYIATYNGRVGVEPIVHRAVRARVKIAPSTYYQRINHPDSDAELEDAYLANARSALHEGDIVEGFAK